MIRLQDSFEPSPSANKVEVPKITSVLPYVDKLFSDKGFLVKDLQLEFRPEQSNMAKQATEHLQYDSPLLFEAGTGVGKSLAYLFPGILHAVSNERKCVISTNTIALQEQIKSKDLPFCKYVFETFEALKEFKDFKTALLIGRGNYLCGTRLKQALNQKAELFPSNEQNDLNRILEWSKKSENGIIQELTPAPSSEVWDWVNADGPACNSRNCKPETCFYQKARSIVEKSQVIIVNHSLLFALLGAGLYPRGESKGILFPNDFLILDEAHTVPSTATEHFGERVSSFGLRKLLLRIFNPRKNRGLLTNYGSQWDREAVLEALDACQLFFEQIQLEILEKQDIARMHEAAWISPLLDAPMQALQQRLGTLINNMVEGPARDELQGARKQVIAYNATINACIDLEPEDHVHWVEKGGHKKSIVTIRTAPLNIAPYLKERLFDRKTGVLLTSATLSEGDNMNGFSQRIGADEIDRFAEGSPFDFDQNMQAYIATDAPAMDPKNARMNLDYLANMIEFCSLQVNGGTLVLFTSYFDMRGIAERVEDKLKEQGRTLLMQGRDGSRTELRNTFADLGNAILLGTDSFWTGIDVPGAALSQVIITRLPFENPTHPIAEARSEWIQSRGGSPFISMTLPEAIVKFRQGVGRLIRKIDDRGIVTVLDSRIVRKQYGRRFLDMIPQKNHTLFNQFNKDLVFKEKV